VTVNVEENGYFSESCENATKSSKLIIFSAIYQSQWYASTCWTDVTNTVSEKCSSTICSFAVENEISPNLCPGNNKELVVTYTCSSDQCKSSLNLQNLIHGT
jgi:hypothetical protein